MARRTDRVRGPRPDRTPAPARVQRVRLTSIVCIWAFIAMFFVAPSFLGNPLFIVPSVLFGGLALSTTRAARRPDSPDSETLVPDALVNATKKQPVLVQGLWSAGGAVRAGAAQKGTLRFADKRLSFLSDEGIPTFDVPVGKVGLAAVPGFWRPQLDIDINGTTNTIRFLPAWDLGATFVGPIIAGEWYAQLRDLGAR